jgi:hypothetical protein
VRQALALSLTLATTPAFAFEWDDGRGALAFRPHVSRHYVSADQRAQNPSSRGIARSGFGLRPNDQLGRPYLLALPGGTGR